MVNIQEWLVQNYLDQETKIIYINQPLEGVLDCKDYKGLEKIFISSSIDSSKFEIKKGSYYGKETKIISYIPAQTYLNQEYPTLEERKEKERLYINDKVLERKISFSNLNNLERIRFFDNYLTSLNLNSYKKLKKISCYSNQLTTLNLGNLEQLEILFSNLEQLEILEYRFSQAISFTNSERITRLDISSNNIYSSDFAIFSPFRNLEWLKIGNESKNKYNTRLRTDYKFSEAKEKLEKQLWKDIHKSFAPKYKKEWLEAGFSKEQTKEIFKKGSQAATIEVKDSTFIKWFIKFKKLDLNWALENEEEFRNLRDNYRFFGTCEECNQPNTSTKWCKSCNAQHFQAEFNNWTSGNPQIDSFIQKCQLEATNAWNVLEWIPYEQFTNIEHIADGGFGKVYKSEWWKGSIESWDYYWNRKWVRHGKTVALKTLFNSQNLNTNFLEELTLYKMFRSEVSQMVPCYGVSRDSKGNYIMVMEYMKEGNLRDYLRKNCRELDLERQLKFLKQITQGLKDIHRKKLVHRDFHSGNIIVGKEQYVTVCRITDLGLSKPAFEINNSYVYGIMPYVAPEVLRGRSYTQKADIYSLGMIMYEIITRIPLYAKQNHDINLALQICQGERPKFPNQLKYPQILVDLIKQCWESEPNNRPTAREVSRIVEKWFYEYSNYLSLKKNTELYYQYEEAEKYNKTLPDEIRYQNYKQPPKVWHSKPINTKQITQLLREKNNEHFGGSKDLELDLNNFDLDKLNFQEDPQEESSTQAQVETPPKN